MLRPMVAVFWLTVAASNALAQTSANDLSGNWIVTWTNSSKNSMSLAIDGAGRFSGTYQNDDKASCKVTGNFNPSSRRLAFQIVCPKWDIRMQGVAAANGKTISGTYQAYIDAAGDFTMEKR